jgi:hypothetical protein
MSEDSRQAISPLRQRMIDDMRMRKLERRTQEMYIRSRSNPHSTTPPLTPSAGPRFPPLGVARLPPLTPKQRGGLHLHGPESGNPYQKKSVTRVG